MRDRGVSPSVYGRVVGPFGTIRVVSSATGSHHFLSGRGRQPCARPVPQIAGFPGPKLSQSYQGSGVSSSP